MVSITGTGPSTVAPKFDDGIDDAAGAAPPPPPPADAGPVDSFGAAPKAGELTGTPAFKALDPSTQAAVTDAQAAAKTPEAQKNLASLVGSPGFAKLTPGAQAETLKALMKDPANAAYAADLRAVVNNGGPYAELCVGSKGPAVKRLQEQLKAAGFDPGTPDSSFGPQTKKALEAFQAARGLKKDGVAGMDSLGELNQARFSGLPEASQKQLVDQLANFPTDPGARATLEKMATAPGFKGLPADQQDKLLKLVGGTNRDLSQPARQAMDALVKDPAFAKASPADQQAKLSKFLTDESGLPDVVAPAAGAFDAKRARYTVTGPVTEKNHDFRGTKADALKYEVEVNGQKIPVYMPKNPSGALKYQTIDEVAKGLAALPESSRKLVKGVTMNQVTNPDDAHWAQVYHDPNFHSYMTAGAEGQVTIYPGNTKESQSYLDGTMIHETGHTLSMQKWGSSDTDPRWNDWKNAAASDKTHASAYAKNSPGEDFGETLQLYQQVKGTPQEAEIRALMPARFKIIDELLAGKR